MRGYRRPNAGWERECGPGTGTGAGDGKGINQYAFSVSYTFKNTLLRQDVKEKPILTPF
jgi:uncharacterized sporulation protein YeaH/YhbH (DUF444 family)